MMGTLGLSTNLYVTCETTASIVHHIRRIAAIPVSFSGHSKRPNALCGATIAWDTKIPLAAANCKGCLELFAKEQP